jgi:hypothetical protein
MFHIVIACRSKRERLKGILPWGTHQRQQRVQLLVLPLAQQSPRGRPRAPLRPPSRPGGLVWFGDSGGEDLCAV